MEDDKIEKKNMNDRVSSYLQYLPAIFHGGGEGDKDPAPFIGRFLLAFEAILTGLPVFTAPLDVLPPVVDFKLQLPADLAAKITYDAEQRLLRFNGIMSKEEQAALDALVPNVTPSDVAYHYAVKSLATAKNPGLEKTIGALHRYFDPAKTDEEFLPWLANWVALSLRADWDLDTKRAFIREVVGLYRLRGTKAGLLKMLNIYTGREVEIYDEFERPAHFFQVRLTLNEADPDELKRKQQIAKAIIEQEKPAHTFFALKIVVPAMRLVSLALQKREGGKPPLLILSGPKTPPPRGNTLLGTAVPT